MKQIDIKKLISTSERKARSIMKKYPKHVLDLLRGDRQKQDVQMVAVNCKSCIGTGNAKNASGLVYTSYDSPCCMCNGKGKVQVPISSLMEG